MITLKAMTTGKSRRINRAPSGREFIMEGFLESGLVSYEDVDQGISRLDKPVIDKMLNSFIGCPLVIEHTDLPKNEVLNGKKDERGNEIKVGEVTRAWWNADTGKYDCAFTTENDKALDLIKKGWSGSCAYNIKGPLGAGGELHAMRYDNTILDGEFEHLALVPSPRYEDCAIRMNGKAATIKENSRVGDVYKIDGIRHVCIEDNGDRGKFRAMAEDMPGWNKDILPTAVYRFADIKENNKVNSSIILKNASINLSACDLYEQRFITDFMNKGNSLEKAAELCINQVEGDRSQLSPELLKYAKNKGLLNSKIIVLKNK